MTHNEQIRRPRLVVLVGPSGSGKTTLAHRLMDRRPGQAAFSVSHTTRPMRVTEVDGQDYHFVDRATFEQMRDRGAFVEWAEVHGNYYGTSRAEVDRHLAAGRDVLFDVDIVGAHNLHQVFGPRALLVFVLPPTWAVMVARLERRGSETEATLRRRLRTARRELQTVLASAAPWRVVENGDLDLAVGALERLVYGDGGPPTDLAVDPLVQAFVGDAVSDDRSAER